MKDARNTSSDEALELLLRLSAKLQHDAIARRAHQVFLERGGAHGQDLQDWLSAERELLGRR